MKIKRFFAPDIRQAMRMVREEQGPDAVILSNRRVNGGIEIVAAVDYDEAALAAQLRAQASTPSLPAAGSEAAATAKPQPQPRVRPASGTGAFTPPPSPEAQPRAGSESLWSQEPTLMEMRSELNTLRRMLEGQLSSLAWGSFSRGEPRRVELIQRLMRFGMSAAQCRSIVETVAREEGDAETLWRRALDIVTRSVPVYRRNLLEEGGIVALVGPTGAGKTTTAAKLAAHYALRHGKRHVALVTIDNYRVGAYEQLRTYGRLLDVPVRIADSRDELRRVLDDLVDRSLVLIDTSGMSPRDSGLAAQADLIDKADLRKKSLLVLPATSRQSGLEDVISSFACFDPDACVITKIDESTCLGGTLSAAVGHDLPIAFVTDGQRVPEDLHPARAEELVSRSVHITNISGPRIDEDLVTLTFGREIANAHL